MMEEADPRVKQLQNLAWSVQNLTNRPGCRLPEATKRASYRVTSRAIALCTDAVYTEEADFLQRAAVLTKEIEAKKIELQEEEATVTKGLKGKCFRAAPGGRGGYVVGAKGTVGGAVAEAAALAACPDAAGAAAAPAVPAGGGLAAAGAGEAPVLAAAEVAARLAEDAEALQLSGTGLGDADVEQLCGALRDGGAELTELDLSHNSVSDTGLQRLVVALAGGVCPRLKELRLEGNGFGPLGKQMLTGGLATLRRGLDVHLETRSGAGAGAAPATTAAAAAAVANTAAGGAGDAGAFGRLEGGTAGEVSAGAAPAAAACGPSGCGTAQEESAAAVAAGAEGAEGAAVAPGHGSAEAGGGGCKGSNGAVDGDPSSDRATVELLEAGSLRVLVPLPDGIRSARDLDLEVSARRLVVHARGVAASAGRGGEALEEAGGAAAAIADVALPEAVDADSAEAAFSRRRREVAVILKRL